MKTAGVVVLYNPDSRVEENIKSYIDGVDILFAVDNSACDNSARFNGEKTVYIPNKENLGVAAALNIGANRAIEMGYEWLLTMDQDSKFDAGAVNRMRQFVKDLKDDKQYAESIGFTYEKLGLVSPFHRIETNKDEKAEGIDSPAVVMTSGNLISLNAFKAVDGFKEWMFIDAVDFDYCLNLRKNGFLIARLNFVELNHNVGKNTVIKHLLGHRMCTYNHPAVRRYYIVRNRYYVCDMYKKDFPEFCAHEKGCTKKEIIKIILLENQKIKKLRAMYKGFKDYKKGIKGKMPV